jgi:hypothetical protein
MDLSKFKTSDWLLFGGGLVTLIGGLFLNWTKVTVGPISASGDHAFNYFFTGGLAFLLTVAAAVIALLRQLGKGDAIKVPWPLTAVLATGIASILMLLRLLIGARGSASGPGYSIGRGAGIYVTALGVFAALAGSFIAFTESGGTINDLKDINKMKREFGINDGPKGGEMPPPPPPPPPSS